MEGGGHSHQVLQLPRRSPTSLPSPLSSTLIPRDFLTQRSGPQDSYPTGPDPLPSIQISTLQPTSSPNVDIAPHNYSFSSNMPSIANPRSPRPLHPKETNENSLPAQGEAHVASSKKGNSVKEAGRPMHVEHSNNIRNVSSPVLSGNTTKQPHPSPPASPRSTDTLDKEEQMIARAPLPRNSSIDSALSSISSTADLSNKSSNDTTQTETPEIQHLISAAGSPENLISHLLKDKHHAASQNAQLWKLVDKQRSLLMGLNQDLERAIKDKEKYRKKMKDLQAQAHAHAHTQNQTQVQAQDVAPHSSDLATSEQSHSTVEKVQHRPQALAKEHNIPQSQASVSTPNKKCTEILNSSPLDPAMMPSPLHLLHGQQKHQGLSDSDASEATDNQPTPRPVPNHTSTNTSAVSSQHSLNEKIRQAAEESFLKSPSPTQTRSANHNVDSTVSLPPVQVAESRSVAERTEKTLPPTRKPPPAPLNLDQAKPKSPVMLDFVPVGQTGSDQESSQQIPEIAVTKRGRRKTRDEDDRDRELAAQREEAARSRSSKSSKSGKKKSKQETNAEPTIKVVPAILPTSPRQVAIPPPYEAALDGPSPPNSIAAVLSPQSLGAAPIVERTINAPPMSPGLPLSPRPVDRPLGSPMPRLPREGSGIPLSPPMSPRGGPAGLPLSPRPPRSAIPPPLVPPVVSSPPPSQDGFPQPGSPRSREMPRPTVTTTVVHSQDGFSQPGSPRSREMPHPTVITTVMHDKAEHKASPVSPFHGVHIDRALMDPAYPNLLLPPRYLQSIIIRVSSSRLRPKRQSYINLKSNDEDPVFTLSIFSRSEGRELWRIEKVIMALPQLDQQMKNVTNFGTKLPERKLFSGHSPAIVDARRNALNQYFGELLEAAVDERSALVICQFLSNDVIEARDDETSLLTPTQRNKPVLALGPEGRPVKEGYLTKRGKNFGGWKVRYFILQGTELKYFEAPGGTHLGTIKLQNAQIGKQTQSSSPSRTDDDIENQYRHAFLVLEPKRKDSSSLVRHVLCAESDEERDEWVLVLTQHCDNQSDDEPNKKQSRRAEDGKSHVTGFEAKVKQYSDSQAPAAHDDRAHGNELKVISYEQVTPGVAPMTSAQQTNRRQEATPSPASTSSESGPAQDQQAAFQSVKAISGPKNGSVIQDVGSWGNKPVPQTAVKDKKRSMWGFRQRGASDTVQNTQPIPNGGAFNSSQNMYASGRAVFGLPLAEAVEFCPPRGVNVMLPAVVYRCIEYLRAKDASSEEGIFRLSGSNIVIKALRERFNTEGDVNFLVDDQYYDVHAVASLFKSYLRELPTTVLTKELHLDFLHVLELDEKQQKIAAFNVLVHRLPRVNLALLKALSQYLIEIANNADKNKMSIRNMGIVFSPTLNIPAPVFGMFLTDFEAIFGTEPAENAPIHEQTKTVELSVPNHLTAGDIRSPRHQMFTDLPTPAYNQTTFSKGQPPSQFPTGQPSAHANPPPTANVAHNTGFIPMQPSYETNTYVSDPQVPTQAQKRYSMVPPSAQRAEYGSMNMMLAPSNAASLKAKRRESSMLFMGMGNRKSSMPKMRDDSGKSYTH
jgi:RalA-binding protein 1